MKFRAFAFAITIVSLAGCWNGGNSAISFGNVSIGQQLIDLKTALDGNAITQQEYDDTKQSLLLLNNLCEATDPEEA